MTSIERPYRQVFCAAALDCGKKNPPEIKIGKMLDSMCSSSSAKRRVRSLPQIQPSQFSLESDVGYPTCATGFKKRNIHPGAVSAVAALCAFALLPLGIANAATVQITGAKFGKDGIVQFPGYGTAMDKNNVVGSGSSGLSDPTQGAGWRTQGDSTSSAVISNVPTYSIDWYFAGAESGHTIKFMSQSLQFVESDQNNNNNHPGIGQPGIGQPGIGTGWLSLGTTHGSGQGQFIPFTLTDTNANNVIANGVNHKPGAFVASLMFAYVEPLYRGNGALKGWKVTTKPTDWFAFGYDDPGSANNDHDDFMMIGHLRATPIPGALGLMGSFLGGSYLVGRWRRRRTRRPGLAVS
jgi:hypothetical protein